MSALEKLYDAIVSAPETLAQAGIRVAGTWGLWFYQSVSAQNIATVLAIIYTCLQIYLLLRDKIFGDKKE